SGTERGEDVDVITRLKRSERERSGYGKGPEPLGDQRRHRTRAYASQPSHGRRLAFGEVREGDSAGRLGDASERTRGNVRFRHSDQLKLARPHHRAARNV